MLRTNKYRIFRALAAAAAIAIIVVPALFYNRFDLENAKNLGYLGFLIANYFGYGLYILPFLVTRLNPLALILIGAFGATIDEFFAWYFGKTSEKYEVKNAVHKKVEHYITRYGMLSILTMGVLPLPGFIATLSAFVAGHFGFSFQKYFIIAFGGRLISRIVWTVGFLYASGHTELF